MYTRKLQKSSVQLASTSPALYALALRGLEQRRPEFPLGLIRTEVGDL